MKKIVLKSLKIIAIFCVTILSAIGVYSLVCDALAIKETGYTEKYTQRLVRHKHSNDEGYYRPKFVTKYTEEEHRNRIYELAYKRFNKLAGDLERLYEVFTLYSLSDEPEYFLIQEYSKDYTKEDLNKKNATRYWVGFIENDKYYLVDDFRTVFGMYCEEVAESSEVNFFSKEAKAYEGMNPYLLGGVMECKKYYGHNGQFMWEENNLIWGFENHAYVYDIAVNARKKLALGEKKELNEKSQACRFVYYSEISLLE